jgi:hypothetical protein
MIAAFSLLISFVVADNTQEVIKFKKISIPEIHDSELHQIEGTDRIMQYNHTL